MEKYLNRSENANLGDFILKTLWLFAFSSRFSLNSRNKCVWSFYLRLSEKASTPHLDGQYPPPTRFNLPSILATFTTLPLAFFRSGMNCRVTSMSPIRLTSKTLVKSSISIQSVGPMGIDLPALFTSPQRPAAGKQDKVGESQLLFIQISFDYAGSFLSWDAIGVHFKASVVVHVSWLDTT